VRCWLAKYYLRAISRLVNIRSGQIRYNGRNITRYPAYKVVHFGIAHSLKDAESYRGKPFSIIWLGAYIRPNQAAVSADIKRQFEIFRV